MGNVIGIEIPKFIDKYAFNSLQRVLYSLDSCDTLCAFFTTLNGYPFYAEQMSLSIANAGCTTIGVGVRHVHDAGLLPYTTCDYRVSIPGTTFLPSITEYKKNPDKQLDFYSIALKKPKNEVSLLFDGFKYLDTDKARKLSIINLEMEEVELFLKRA